MAYVEVAGHQVWHEVQGEGEPLVLGAFGTADPFGPLTGLLRDEGYRTVAPERRAQGHSADRAWRPRARAPLSRRRLRRLVVGGPCHAGPHE